MSNQQHLKMIPGDVMFVRTAKRDSKETTGIFKFSGHAFGLMLGHVAAGKPDPTITQVMALLGQVGFCPFDLVKEFLGDEKFEEFILAFEKKYHEPLEAPASAGTDPGAGDRTVTHEVSPDGEVTEIEMSPSKIVNIHGRPIEH